MSQRLTGKSHARDCMAWLRQGKDAREQFLEGIVRAARIFFGPRAVFIGDQPALSSTAGFSPDQRATFSSNALGLIGFDR